jgi:hypothetical protein
MDTVAGGNDRQSPDIGAGRVTATRGAMSGAGGHLQKNAIKLLGWLVFGYLLLKLVPDLKQALRSVEHVGLESC